MRAIAVVAALRLLALAAAPSAAEPTGPAPSARPAAVARWSLERLPAAQPVWGGFDPRRHTPNFSNDQTVRWRDRHTERAYRGGLCWGICELAHLAFRELVAKSAPDPRVREPLHGLLYPEGAPPPGSPLRDLRRLCERDAATRERVCEIAAALQLDAPADPRLPSRDAAALVSSIVDGIRRDGTAILHVRRVDPQTCRSVNGHNVLAYGAFPALARRGSERRRVLAIRVWDPLLPFPSRSGPAAGAAEVLADRGFAGTPECALLFDPVAGTLTFTAEYLAYKAWPAGHRRALREVLQPGPALEIGRDISLRRPDAGLARAMLQAARAAEMETRVAHDTWPRIPGPIAAAE